MSGDRRLPRFGGVRFDATTTEMPAISALPAGRGRRGRRVLAIAPPPPPPEPYVPPADQYGRPPRRHRNADAALFDLTPHDGWVLVCGLNTLHHHADPAAQDAFYVYDELRATAHAAGWRLDATGRWCCPSCQMTRRFRSLAPVTLWADGAAQARINDDPGLELWLRAVTEQALIEDVAAAASPGGRHSMDTAR